MSLMAYQVQQTLQNYLFFIWRPEVSLLCVGTYQTIVLFKLIKGVFCNSAVVHEKDMMKCDEQSQV